MKEEIKVGDIVWLKSGSPAMTVRSVGIIDDADTVEVDWFCEHTPYDAKFSLVTLTKTQPMMAKRNGL